MDERLHKKVDEIFKDSLRAHSEAPSPEVWDEIENDLDKEENLFNIERTKRRIRSAAFFIFILAGGGLFVSIHQKSRKFSGADFLVENKNVQSSKSGNKQLPFSLRAGSIITKAAGENNSEKNNWEPAKETNYYQSQNAIKEIAINELFDNADESGKPDLSLAGLHPASVEMSFPESISVHTEKDAFVPVQQIPEKMIVRPERQTIWNRLSITPYFSQEFAGYNLSDDDATAADGREIENRERNVFSASVGLYVNYRLKKRWVLQSGITYSWSSSIIDSATSYAIEDNNGNIQFKLNTISGYGYLKPTSGSPPNVGDSVYTDKSYSRLNYLTIPLILSYKVPMKKFSLLVGAGISVNFLTSATLKTKIYGPGYLEAKTVTPMKGLKNINYGIILKADLEYHINNIWGINIIPSFKNSLSPINLHSALSAYPYNFGIGAGISYRF
jgi:Outer membrane protein beta-barrel domain